jgi:hypothetical protein
LGFVGLALAAIVNDAIAVVVFAIVADLCDGFDDVLAGFPNPSFALLGP